MARSQRSGSRPTPFAIPFLYTQHVRPQIYVPGHMTDVQIVSSSLQSKKAFLLTQETAAGSSEIPGGVVYKPELRWLVDPNDLARPMVYDPDDSRWSEIVTRKSASSSSAVLREQRSLESLPKVLDCEGGPFRPPSLFSVSSDMRHVSPLCLLLLLCFTGLCHVSVAEEPDPVRVALTREASVAPLLIAIDAGYFKSVGLNPRLAFFDGDTAVSAAVASGKVDIGMAALSAAFYRYTAAHRLKIIASRSSDQTGFPMYAFLISKEARAAGFSGVRGLPNARIGVADSDSGEYYGLYSIASRFKLDSGSIRTTVLKSPEGELSALSRREIEAVILPYATALHAARQGRSLLRLSDFAQWQQGVVFASAQKIAADRILMERFMQAYQRGTAEYALNFLSYDDGGDFIPGPHYDRYLDLIARQVNISSAMLARTKIYCDRRANLDVTDIEKQVQFWQNRGRVDKSVVAADLLDRLSFIGEDFAPARHAENLRRAIGSASNVPAE